MEKIQVNIKDVLQTVSQTAIDSLKSEALDGLRMIQDGSGAGNDFLGWVKLPSETPAIIVDEINAA
ncbi:MAG: glucose-6-phosphate isomerase, partial [Muribaculaceae bacterium]|nr:glucose-6-phosphate isomerase [Muribaculaceae bacterium]